MDQVAQVREKIDIVALISEFIPLKRIGRNFTTACPFHNEKTPSFVVSPERQIWHCFGCNIGGDCFTFLMQYEHIEFPEALRILAKRAGVELQISHQIDGIASAKEKIYVINRLACEFYHYVLTRHKAGANARLYLNNRKIREGTIKTFMLGFAPSQGDALQAYLLKKKGYTKKDLIDAGLATLRGDFFLNRIIFPIFDHRDNIIGFSGRVLFSEQMPKYINTRETLIYHKGNVFFGLNIARQAIKKENKAIIVEGEFDVISCFQEGITNTIAIKGTALTEQQVILISRFANKVSLCLDMDRAGQEAIKRSASVLEKKGIITSVIVPSIGKDADESIRENAVLFKKAVQNGIGVYDYLLSQTLAENDKATAEGKKKIADEMFPSLNDIENEIIKEHYLKKLAVALDTSYESITRQIERIKRKEVDKPIVVPSKDKRPRRELLEEYILALILQHDRKVALAKLAAINISDITFGILAYEKIYKHIADLEDNVDSEKIVNTLPSELLPAYDICYLLPLPIFSSEELLRSEVTRVSIELKTIYLRSKIKELGDKIKELEKTTLDTSDDQEKLSILRDEFLTLVTRLQTLSG